LDTAVDLLSFMRLLSIAGQLQVVVADPDDDKVLETAVAAGATHLVSGDRRHLLPLREFQGIRIVSPAEFLILAAAK
jgi:predicted nucleic acid-binding protein